MVSRTSLAPLVGSENGEQRIQSIMQRNLAILRSGNNLLSLRSRGATPELSFEVVNASVETFKEKADADRSSQADLAISFYGARLREAEDQLAKSNEALRRYVAANPGLTTSDRSIGPAGATTSRLGPSRALAAHGRLC